MSEDPLNDHRVIDRGDKLHSSGTAALFAGATSRAERDRRCAVAVHQHGYTLKAVAEFLGLHYATVSRALAWAEAQRRSTPMSHFKT